MSDEIVYDEIQTDRKTGEPIRVRLTADQLNPAKDPVLRSVYDIVNSVPEEYRALSALKQLLQLADRFQPEINEQFVKFRRRGFLPVPPVKEKKSKKKKKVTLDEE